MRRLLSLPKPPTAVLTGTDVLAFGALSEWNGQFSSASASQAFQAIASLGSNSIELTARIWTQTGTADILAHIDGGHAELGGFAHHIDRKMAGLIPFQRMGRKLAIGKIARHIADGDPVFV